MPRVRVVIPTYNRSRLLSEAVQTALDQSFEDFEIVVADDGSSDDTRVVVAALMQRDSRIRYTCHKNLGCAGTRNAALKLPGPFSYVALLDDDDLWRPDHLEEAVQILAEEPEVTLVFARVATVDSTGGKWTAELRRDREKRMQRPLALVERRGACGSHLLQPAVLLRSLVRSEFSPHPSTVVVRAERVPFQPWFDERLAVLEDVEFYMNLARRSLRFAFIDAVHSTVRYQGDNLTSWIDWASPMQLRRMRSVLGHFESRVPLCRDHGDRRVVRRDIASSAYLVAQCLAEQSALREARRFYWKSTRHRVSLRTVLGLTYACLPVAAFRALRDAKRTVSRALSGRRAGREFKAR